MEATDEETFLATISCFLTGMDAAGRISGQLEPDDFYAPASATTDGWIAAQNAWKTVALGQLIEIRLNSADTLCQTLDTRTVGIASVRACCR